RLTRARPCRNGREISAGSGSSCREGPPCRRGVKPDFIGLFALARGLPQIGPWRWPCQVSWSLSECPMLPALAALSGLDALQSLFSSKSSSTQSTGFSQTINDPFDVSGTTSQGGTAQASIGSPSYQQISPQTMSALIEAQSQSGTSASTTSTSTSKDPL